ncbi:hypothetical protein N7532_008132 [Penicillium argentinense]|uniref:SUZ domain-containing protein n=1 Tax=Penicillium argentinense TaxID=1131581 RepID=A0A9W9EWR7_9EURO|nr:uncharacterized protein N7532_008132 [Penicillium argentinense]KAJ5089448.1 hypothetical protein N7532_008132 [Penicillium argentinense]
MSSKPEVPDAWDDNWESQADKIADQPTPPPEKKVSSKVTKAQRRAQQAEFNRQLWAEAYDFLWTQAFNIGYLGANQNTRYSEAPTQAFHFVEARSEVPLKQEFKPTVTLLSRRPQIATRQTSSSGDVDSAAIGVGQLGLDDGDSDEEANKPPEPTPEERQAIALKNLEEKQRKYEEVRERLFGSPSATTSGNSSPGSTTPPRQPQSGEGRGKGKGRGGGREKRDSSTASSRSKNLYDPSNTTRLNGSHPQRRERQQSNQNTPDKQSAPQQPSRTPRGPDGSGRGGYGFGNRGARAS